MIRFNIAVENDSHSSSDAPTDAIDASMELRCSELEKVSALAQDGFYAVEELELQKSIISYQSGTMLSEESHAILQGHVSSIRKRLGHPSVKSLSAESVRGRSTTRVAALEGIGSTLKSIWDKLVEILSAIWNKLKSFFTSSERKSSAQANTAATIAAAASNVTNNDAIPVIPLAPVEQDGVHRGKISGEKLHYFLRAVISTQKTPPSHLVLSDSTAINILDELGAEIHFLTRTIGYVTSAHDIISKLNRAVATLTPDGPEIDTSELEKGLRTIGHEFDTFRSSLSKSVDVNGNEVLTGFIGLTVRAHHNTRLEKIAESDAPKMGQLEYHLSELTPELMGRTSIQVPSSDALVEIAKRSGKIAELFKILQPLEKAIEKTLADVTKSAVDVGNFIVKVTRGPIETSENNEITNMLYVTRTIITEFMKFSTAVPRIISEQQRILDSVLYYASACVHVRK